MFRPLSVGRCLLGCVAIRCCGVTNFSLHGVGLNSILFKSISIIQKSCTEIQAERILVFLHGVTVKSST